MAKHNDEQSKIVKILEEHPHISYACKKVGISRMSFYRWMKGNLSFRMQVNDAMENGRAYWTEVAEAVVLKSMKEGKSADAKWYLTHNDPRYMDERRKPQTKRELTDEQILELRTMLAQSKPIDEEYSKKIVKAFKAWGLLDEKNHFGKEFVPIMKRVEEERKRQKKWYQI